MMRYSFRHSHFWLLHQSSRSGFSAPRTLPYHDVIDIIHSFGQRLEPRYVVGARALDQ